MNRLVIIGNGFDLAHGLPTSYGHFINDFWENFKTNCKSDEYQKLISTNTAYDGYYSGYKAIENFDDLKSNLINYSKGNGHNYDFNNFVCSSKNRDVIFEFKSDFFKLINQRNSENWVDIENEYYKELKNILKSTSGKDIIKSKEEITKNRKGKVEKLNNEFEEVKNLLEKYLEEKVVEKYNFGIPNINELNKFHNIFYPDILEDFKIESWKENFSKDDKEYINELIKEGKAKDVKLRFLNFNYTPTLSSYFHMNRNLYNDSEYFIHGKLGDLNNKINFGFGDEMDDDYKMIENIDENEYLKNFKSFQYFQNDTYKKLLDFVESEKFEVYIMGSSCGLSDRTLLNTIFENINCRSIKVFYYQWKDKDTDEINDNFTELTQNISRHFNDKKLMRSKIVHKKPDQIMPEIKLSKKE